MTVKTKEVKISGDSGSPIISFIKLLRPIQAKSLDLLNLSLQQKHVLLTSYTGSRKKQDVAKEEERQKGNSRIASRDQPRNFLTGIFSSSEILELLLFLFVNRPN